MAQAHGTMDFYVAVSALFPLLIITWALSLYDRDAWHALLRASSPLGGRGLFRTAVIAWPSLLVGEALWGEFASLSVLYKGSADGALAFLVWAALILTTLSLLIQRPMQTYAMRAYKKGKDDPQH
jgi:hypothetical protein